MECHVYFDPEKSSIAAFKDAPAWVGPRYVLLGTFQFTKMSEPTHDSILAWVLPRLKLLEISHNERLTVVNYASHAYWGFPPYE